MFSCLHQSFGCRTDCGNRSLDAITENGFMKHNFTMRKHIASTSTRYKQEGSHAICSSDGISTDFHRTSLHHIINEHTCIQLTPLRVDENINGLVVILFQKMHYALCEVQSSLRSDFAIKKDFPICQQTRVHWVG